MYGILRIEKIKFNGISRAYRHHTRVANVLNSDPRKANDIIKYKTEATIKERS